MLITPFISLILFFFSDREVSKPAEFRPFPFILCVKPVASGIGNGFSWDNASSDLQAMINLADSLTSIWVAEGTYKPQNGQSFVLKRGVKIYGGFFGNETDSSQRSHSSSLTILQGNGNRVINNNDNNLNNATILDGLTITSGSAPIGAGMYNSNASPSINNCRFTANNAVDSGGAIFNANNSSPIISNCIIESNNALKGAGIYNGANCSPTITNSTFQFNGQATTGGGAMVNRNNSPVITGCSFRGNRGIGIASSMHNYNCSATISNCGFSSGTSDNFSIINDSSPVSITNSSFSGNFGDVIRNNNSNITVKYCTFIGNRGAGIYNNASSPVITNCLFSGNNNSRTNEAGCLYNLNGSSPVVTNCTFAGNESMAGKAIISRNSILTMANCIIWGNDGGVDNGTSTGTVRNSIVQGGFSGTGNKNADPKFIDDRNYTAAPFTDGNFALRAGSPAYNAGNNASVPAGIVTDLEGKPRIVNNIVDMGTYEYRVAPGAGNILYVNKNSGSNNRDGNSWANSFTDLFYAVEYANAYKNNWTAANPLRIFVANATYMPLSRPDNPSVKAGAADRDKAFPVIPHVQLYGGFAPASGIDSLNDARIFGAGGTFLSGNIGAADSADNCYHVIVSSGTVGAALLDGFTVASGNSTNSSDTGNLIVNGYAITRSWGAGLICNTSSPAIVNCSFSGNNSIAGGGMFTIASSPSVNNCTFTNNGASFGGAIFAHTGSAPSIRGCNFSGNRVYSYGGAVYNNDPDSIVHYVNCNFSGNYTINTGGGGGAMFNNNSKPSISYCRFSNNSGYNGGGIWNYQSASPVIDSCYFTSNTGGMFGGGIYNDPQAVPMITRSIFSGNYSQFGGGMLNGGPAIVTGSVFTNNSAFSYGGGVYNSGVAMIAVYTNCIFSGNSVVHPSGGGGGAFNNSTFTNFINCTFQGNNAAFGGAMKNWTATSTYLRNSIMWGNSSTIHNESFSSGTEILYSDVQGNTYGSGNVNVDPLFVNAAQPQGPDGIWGTADDGLRLQPCSPLINIGSNSLIPAGITTDLGGAPRIQYSIVDMGAFESGVPPCGETFVNTPTTRRINNITRDDNNKPGLLVYPNPSTDKVYISNATAGASYTVFDNMGHKIKTGRISDALQEIIVTGLAAGIYYIDITGTGGKIQKLKLLKK